MNNDYPDQLKYEQCLKDIAQLLQEASGIFRLMEREHVRRDGFTSSQAFLLSLLLERGSLSVNDIARNMKLDKSSASRLVKNLIRDNYLVNETSDQDRRFLKISLTGKGKDAAARIEEKRKEYYSSIIENLPRGHVREVMNSAEVLVGALKKTL